MKTYRHKSTKLFGAPQHYESIFLHKTYVTRTIERSEQKHTNKTPALPLEKKENIIHSSVIKVVEKIIA